MVLIDVPFSINLAICKVRSRRRWGTVTRPRWQDENRALSLPYHPIGDAAEQHALHGVVAVCADDDELCLVVPCVADDLVRWASDHDARDCRGRRRRKLAHQCGELVFRVVDAPSQ
jgi:hypothetical protein